MNPDGAKRLHLETKCGKHVRGNVEQLLEASKAITPLNRQLYSLAFSFPLVIIVEHSPFINYKLLFLPRSEFGFTAVRSVSAELD